MFILNAITVATTSDHSHTSHSKVEQSRRRAAKVQHFKLKVCRAILDMAQWTVHVCVDEKKTLFWENLYMIILDAFVVSCFQQLYFKVNWLSVVSKREHILFRSYFHMGIKDFIQEGREVINIGGCPDVLTNFWW